MNIHLPAQAPQSFSGVTEISFAAWIAQAQAGDELEYHRGFLVLDTDKTCTRLTEADCERLTALSRRAIRAAELGLIHLLQRRHGEADYSYLAVVSHLKTSSGLSARLLTEETGR